MNNYSPVKTLKRASSFIGHILRERFDIRHATLQVEPPDFNIVNRLSVPPAEPPSGSSGA